MEANTMTCGIFQRNFGGLMPGCGGGCGGWPSYGSLCDNKNAIFVSGIRAGILSGDYDMDKLWASSGW
jgi:hypothetical protein